MRKYSLVIINTYQMEQPKPAAEPKP
jgi:vacuolar-type H+-ATPase subunit F/Vma7